MELNYIVTETRGPDSFDPVNADKTQNHSVMRMLFATPLEMDKNNLLQSKILKSFEYKSDSHQIIFEVRDDQKYSDDTKLTPDDVALAIVRIAYYRPQFPVVKDIEGVKEWIESQKGLLSFPSGIKIEKNRITIQLTHKVADPLFRFCLELFSVIPARCIDRNTFRMTCDLPPSSGYFTLKSISREELVFEKRKNQNMVDLVPFEIIRFKFEDFLTACKKDLAFNDVISGVELDVLKEDCSQYIQSKRLHWMPAIRFGILRFNPNIKPFNIQINRQLFSETVRNILRRKSNGLLIENGLFSQSMPGYLSSDKLRVSFEKNVRESFRGIKMHLPKIQTSGLKIIFDAIIEAAQELQIEVVKMEDPGNDGLVESFLLGKVPVIAGASGFWPQNPISDISMWFTPHLHKTMTFVWDDKNIYDQISALESEMNPIAFQQKMEQLNRYLSEQAILSPIVHFRRLFISGKHVTSLNIHQSVTSPAPWQIMSVIAE